MPDENSPNILLDQNVPYAVKTWLQAQRSSWTVRHVKDLGFEGQSDDFLYRWAQQEKAIVAGLPCPPPERPNAYSGNEG